ncbi:hypothetical protein [Nocardia rhizosphaerihabitans]|uniref:Uncharacterized protein n=1 Tax=Nocardia rhizosphaerihabitans TaxID=1691570 RepID=A0ABQ2KMQ0_9NOCA|nr:hypothetical protein [Nocardia rhizosphaerihabitans]GGN87153.1 hypothetical protein GCM10011610_43300 [Nocardia rhizosphaerihabitans]
MDNRKDPIQIIASVSRRDDKQRAFEVWIWRAGKEGWSVSVVSSSVDEPGHVCGIVDVEGLKYRINLSSRVRKRVYYAEPGQHAGAAVAEMTTGESEPPVWGWGFAPAAWAEPIIDAD